MEFNWDNINTNSEYENNDSDYEPSSNSATTSDNTGVESDKQNMTNNNNGTVNSINISTISIRGCNDENMYVSDSKPKGAQKKNFCYFCKKFQSKIARHLEKVHRNGEVKKFSVFAKS